MKSCMIYKFLIASLFVSNTIFLQAQGNFASQKVVDYPQEADSIITITQVYKSGNNGISLEADFYYPNAPESDTHYAAVILISGYPDSVIESQLGVTLRYTGMFTSWCRLLALNGLLAITYETTDPSSDIGDLLSYIHNNYDSLKIDVSRIGIFAISGNVPAAIELLSEEKGQKFIFASLLYGFMPDSSGKFSSKIDSVSKSFGFYLPELSNTLSTTSTPLLIVRAGKDQLPYLNYSIGRFIEFSLKYNLNINMFNYSAGIHAFDILDHSTESINIVRKILYWIRTMT